MIKEAKQVAQRLRQRAKPIQTRIAEKVGDDLRQSYDSLVTEGADTIDELVQEVERLKLNAAAAVNEYVQLERENERLKQEQAQPVACVCKDRPYCNQECNPKTSPVAWRFQDPKDGHWLYTTHITDLSKKFWRLKNEVFEPLYTAPQGQTELLRQALEAMSDIRYVSDYTHIVALCESIKQHLGEA